MRALSRRLFLAAGSGALALGCGVTGARADGRTLRIGYQKIGLLVVARQQRIIERRLADRGIEVSWSEFTAGPPLMEAINAGSIDFGYTGDCPPIFAQAGEIPFVYAAAVPPSPLGEGIIVKAESPLRTLADLKGRRVGFTKASSAHNLTVAALEKTGIPLSDITPVYLAPADAGAAFASDSIDAWTIWDPFLAVAETAQPTRALARSGDILRAYAFLLARRDFAEEQKSTLVEVLAGLQEAASWAGDHRGELAATLAEITGVDLEAQKLAAERTSFGVLPMTPEIVKAQQEVADRFHRAGLIPAPITVAANIWQA